jgi:hypothetical protein
MRLSSSSLSSFAVDFIAFDSSLNFDWLGFVYPKRDSALG